MPIRLTGKFNSSVLKEYQIIPQLYPVIGVSYLIKVVILIMIATTSLDPNVVAMVIHASNMQQEICLMEGPSRQHLFFEIIAVCHGKVATLIVSLFGQNVNVIVTTLCGRLLWPDSSTVTDYFDLNYIFLSPKLRKQIRKERKVEKNIKSEL